MLELKTELIKSQIVTFNVNNQEILASVVLSGLEFCWELEVRFLSPFEYSSERVYLFPKKSFSQDQAYYETKKMLENIHLL